jgi:intracellular sulfur oxidation DsrE/DsrF family protein
MKTKWFTKLFLACSISVAMMFASLTTQAQEEKVFAEKKVVLQISDSDPFKQTLVLNVANNLIKHYGPDKVEVEIVAFGPGLRLLFDENDNKDRIQGLSTNGVRFAACNNTLTNMTKLLGEKPKLNANAKVVDAGVVRVIDLTSEGYTLVKP